MSYQANPVTEAPQNLIFNAPPISIFLSSHKLEDEDENNVHSRTYTASIETSDLKYAGTYERLLDPLLESVFQN
jgi:hypothetical protein